MREELDKATKELKDAEKELADRLKAVKIEDLGWRGGGAGWGGGGGAGGGGGGGNGDNAPIGEGQVIGNGINGKNRYGARNNQSIHDAGYNERVNAGYERNAQSQGYGNSARDAMKLRDQQAKLDRAAARGEDVSTPEGRENILGKKGAKDYEDRLAKDPQHLKEAAKKAAEAAAEKLKEAQEKKKIAEE